MLATGTFQFNSIEDSFKEGLVAPLIEVLLSLFLSMASMIRKLLHNILSPPNGYLIWSTPELVIQTIALFGVIDFIRNVISALLKPGDTLAHLAGELLSLLILSALAFSIPLLREIIIESLYRASFLLLLGILSIIMGLIFRCLYPLISMTSTLDKLKV